jgi:septal ring factor EnvC (AmiA/AmiB activator)
MAGVIDTLEIARDLKASGLTEPQAEALARIFKVRFEADRGELVTRDYLDARLADLRAEIGELRSEMRTEIASVRTEIAELRTELRTETAVLRTEIRTEVAGLRTELAKLQRDLLIKIGGIVTVAVVIVGGLGVLF